MNRIQTWSAMSSLILLIILLKTSQNVYSARILGLFPYMGWSHQMVFQSLLKTLAERGHHITSISFEPLENPPANYTDVSLRGIPILGVECLHLGNSDPSDYDVQPMDLRWFLHQFGALDPQDKFALFVCEKLLDWPGVGEALNQTYDLIITENFNSDCMLGLMHISGLKAPIVSMSSTGLMPWTADRIGLIDNPSYMPTFGLPFTSKMDFWQRLENTFLQIYYKHWFRVSVQIKEQQIIEKHFGRKIPDLRDLAKNVSLVILNTHHSLHGVKPLLPGVVEAGGMHIPQTRKHIPEFIERFINESEHGVILMSFGSIIRTSSMPKYKEDIIVNACAKLKQRVIWKYENIRTDENFQTGNILRLRWLPQLELLEHPKVLAFVTHGGILGMTEAVYAGKPMVVVPVFADQPQNAAVAVDRGIAVCVPWNRLSVKALSEAMEEAISEQIRLKAKLVSRIWRDRPLNPLDTAVYWTERVIRWGHHERLYSTARDLSFIEISLLDVLAGFVVFILVVLSAVFLAFKVLFALIRKFLGFRSKKLKSH